MEEIIWAPWRMEFIEGKQPGEEGCVFCNAASAPTGEWENRLILDRSESVLVIMNRFPYVNAHLLVMPLLHVSSPEDLPEAVYTELSLVLRRCLSALQSTMNPAGFNMGMNLGRAAGAGIEDHIHWHIVPRWNGDNNFMPVIGATRCMPQHLMETYNQLRKTFAGICTLKP
ncbi:HIT domain-containing protein [Myxococcota bacterium]|nr:HIT domain-containing protein [Myxococcota bacterium]MBU1534302.1 HIT domain-containing protein [Myxococcota bacterium]